LMQNSIHQSGFTMINMGNNGKITYMGIHRQYKDK